MITQTEFNNLARDVRAILAELRIANDLKRKEMIIEEGWYKPAIDKVFLQRVLN